MRPRTLVLLTALTTLFTTTVAVAADSLLLTGVVHAERPVDEVIVRVWDVSGRLLEDRARLDDPLFEGTASPGSAFSIPLEDAELPVEVEVIAEDHVALGLTVVTPAQTALPVAWLPAGTTAPVLVLRSGRPVPDALVGGEITVHAGLDGYRGQWLAVVPRSRTDAKGRVSVPVPGRGTVSAWACDGEQHWGRTRRKLQHQSGPLRLELDSAATEVRVTDRHSEPAGGVHLAGLDAPLGCAATTADDGRATVQLGPDDWTLVALGDGQLASRSGHGRPPQELELGLETTPELMVRWTGADDIVLEAAWLPPALHLRPILARGGRAEVPFVRGGELTAWAPEWRQTSVEVPSGEKPVSLDLEAAATVRGMVHLADGTPAPDVPIWPHLAPSFLIGQDLPAMVLRGQLERSWRPWAVTDATGAFTLPPLASGNGAVEARHDGMPPATSRLLELEAGSDQSVELTLNPGTTLRIRVLDPHGEPVVGASVGVHPAPPKPGRQRMVFRFGDDDNERPPLASATTGEDGRASLSAVPVGRLTVRVERSGFVTANLDPIEVPLEGIDLGDVELEQGVTVRGTTVDDRGRPVGDAEVALERSATTMLFTPKTRSDASGRFEISDLAGEGEVYVQARGDGYVPLAPVKVEMPPEDEVDVPMTRERVLEGEVVVSGTRRPVAGAELSITKQREVTVGGSMQMSMAVSLGGTRSDARGAFRIPGLAPGGYSLTAEASGYRTAELAVTVPETGDPSHLMVEMERGHTVDGIVVTADGQPAAGAEVRAHSAVQEGFEHLVGGAPSTETGADGRFRLEGLSEGRHQLMATLDEARASEVVSVPPDTPIELRLEPGRTIVGRVVDADEQPVANAEVSAFASTRGAFQMIDPTTTSRSGRFQLEGVAPGEYRVVASADIGTTSEAVTVADDRDADVVLRISEGGTVAGRVLGLSSAELGLCRVFAAGTGGQPVASDGTFTLTGVHRGTQEVRAMVMPLGRMRSEQVTVEAGETVEVEIDFASGVTLAGSVYRAGRPAAGVMVDVSGRSRDFLGSTVSGTDGSWEVSGLEPGEYEVAARAASGSTLAVESIVISGDAHLDLDIPGGRVSGWVRAAETGRPISGAAVELRSIEPPPLDRSLSTANDGRFSTEELADGAYLVRARAEGWSSAEDTVVLTDGVSQDVILELERSQRLDLLVREPSGQLPSSVQVLAARAGAVAGPIQVACDREGRCSLEGLAPGSYTLLVSAGGSRLLTVRFPGEAISVRLRTTGHLMIEAPVEAGASPWRMRISDAGTGLVLPVGPWQNPEGGEWFPVTGGRTVVPVPVGSWLVEGFAPDGTTHQRQVQVDGETHVTFGGGT